MEHKQSSIITFEKFTWKVENFSFLEAEVYSESFVRCGYQWRISLFPRGNKLIKEDDNLSIYLEALQTSNMSEGWNRDVIFRLSVFNQLNTNMTITKESSNEFNASEDSLGFESFMTFAELHDPKRGFIVNDACIVGGEVFVSNSIHEKPINQTANLTSSLTFGSLMTLLGFREFEVPTPKQEECQGENLSELMDFKGLGQIEKAFVPLLEEVCSQKPSLIVCQQNRSSKCREWAFTALGRVLYFLKTRKVKDMNDLACKDLQIFWEELELFSFDLTWLKPHVQSALGMKRYLEELEEVEKLKINVASLELEMQMLKSKIATVEENLDAARSLLKAKDLEEILVPLRCKISKQWNGVYVPFHSIPFRSIPLCSAPLR
ncbi:MATH domain and coiled-coil domain-containing protein At3g58340-like [Vicia villosa]|uniref:MATH domain and coiled-coil domain-containing protein At3g58340-like n=1 Tax=Vicia villosa TaxID=3911 RepID=UPI00273CEC79|nr:MATH domain and coiled-coil domain-containing protein At3g58340-like [Vicia villosa]